MEIRFRLGFGIRCGSRVRESGGSSPAVVVADDDDDDDDVVDDDDDDDGRLSGKRAVSRAERAWELPHTRSAPDSGSGAEPRCVLQGGRGRNPVPGTRPHSKTHRGSAPDSESGAERVWGSPHTRSARETALFPDFRFQISDLDFRFKI